MDQQHTVRPIRITEEAHLIESFWIHPGAPVGVHMNTMVLASREPVLLDTGVAADREGWLAAVASVVEPRDVRWIVLTHDDHDHVGNLETAMGQFPNATVVASWWMTERLTGSIELDPRRMRWLVSGDTLDIGDRTLVLERPPLFDSPTTRGVFDPSTGLWWAGDFGAAPTPAPATWADDVPADALAASIVVAQQWNSPWYTLLDERRYQHALDHVERMGITTWAHTHGPVYQGDHISTAIGALRRVTTNPVAPQPTQTDLDAIVSSLAPVPVSAAAA
jgi:flavorubredoxin